MSKRGKLYIALVIIAVISIVVLENSKPQEINWFPSYVKKHKIPFGTFVFYEQLERLFGKDNVIDVERPPYEFLNDNDINGTYLFVNNQVSFGAEEFDILLEWTAKGNTLFVASSGFESNVLDTLNLETSTVNSFDNYDGDYIFKLKNKNLDTTIVSYEKADFLTYFDKIDTLKTSIISVSDNKEYPLGIETAHANAIRQPFGEGQIILSNFPQAFTNYFILESQNKNYTAGLLSYIDDSQPIYFDNYYKAGKPFFTSPLFILLNNKTLKWAYYMMLIGVFFYVIFEGKRKQRAIPIVEPLKNKTIDFTRTIANMYYEKGKHHDIAQHKIQHLLEFIRTQLYLNTNTIDTEFIKNLAARSNNSVEDTQTLFNVITSCSEDRKLKTVELERLNRLIETFKSNTKWKTKTK
ncbi:DUF4350 domain-containing protein [Lacinutrix undariae]